jgi:hypothetical protein
MSTHHTVSAARSSGIATAACEFRVGRRRIHLFVVLLLTLAVLVGCSGSSDPTEPEPEVFSLAGDWVRINSSFGELDGMVVRVEAAQTQALITSTPGNVYQFQIGDLKWRDIVRSAGDRFEFRDLVRAQGSWAQSYVPGVIQANRDGTSISISFPTTGTFQDWRRQ